MREYLISLRTEKGLTQKQIDQKLDISESYYNQIEKGERKKKMDITLLNRLSLALEIPITVLINYENKL